MPASAVSLPQLHRRFRPETAYRRASGYRLLPIRFTSLDSARVVLTNLVGERLVLPRAAVTEIVEGRLQPASDLYADLVARHMVADAAGESALDLLATKYRTRLARLADFTALHMFVVTLRCDHSCPYCQVSRVSADKAAYDMSDDTARRAVELMFRTPSPRLKIEFQGGETLLNFPLIQGIVRMVEDANAAAARDVVFVVATNLAPLTVEMLDFFREHKAFVSTSLDGPKELHNANRPRPGNDSYQRAVEGIERCRSALGEDSVAALMTTTLRSLDQPEAIVDEYVNRGFRSIFLRPLSPYGFAAKTGAAIGYPVAEWNAFYERGLRHVLRLNREGKSVREEYAAIVLRRMLTPFATGYVDLQSPAGLGISAAVYNYDGDVYASDEARMLAEAGDKRFRLGNVHANSYEEIFLSDDLQQLLADTMTEATPMCGDCAFEPFCGTDPCFHAATQNDPVGHRPTSAFCARNMFVFRLLIRLLEDDPESRNILEGWAC